MSSLVAIAKENFRQALTGDDKFYKKLVYFFELRVPQSVGITGTTYLFPLALNPQDIRLSEPFAVELSRGLHGGLFVEENGIVERYLTISGHTGFDPRTLDATPGINTLLTPAKRSFGRSVTKSVVLGKLSGQRHFQYLQDRVFRAYADAKQDPSTAADTQLIFHNQKDDEHWLVVPQRFDLKRSASRPLHYEYTIELVVLGPAEAKELVPSEDKSLLDELKDTVATIKRYIGYVNAAVNDIIAAVNDIRQFITSVAQIIDAVTSVIDSVTSFINGLTDLVELPLTFLASTIGLVEAANGTVDAAAELENTVAQLPTNLAHSFAQLQDALEGIGAKPEIFQTPEQKQTRDVLARQQLSTSVTASDIAAVEANPPTSVDAYRELGTGLMPGDVIRADIPDGLGATPPVFRSVRQYTLASYDSLPSIAARELGDIALWPQIARANNLRPPFISEDGLPGTLSIGQTLLIPSTSAPPTAVPNYAVAGITADESPEIALLGIDFALEVDQNGFFDLGIDVEGGSVDFAVSKGRPNLVDGLVVRTGTERGTDPLYQNVGRRRITGTRNRLIDLEQSRFRVGESIAEDPRIASIRSIQLSQPTPDNTTYDVNAEVRNYAQPLALKVPVV